MKKIILLFVFIALHFHFAVAQQFNKNFVDTVSKMVVLSEVVVRNNINVTEFIKRVINDTTFYKAFKNLRILSYSSLNDIRMFDKQRKVKASLQSKTHQNYTGGCRTMQVLSEETTGDFYDRKRNYNYYTAELYASLFFTRGKICGETNIVNNSKINPQNKSGIEKRKEQLKMLFFNPGTKIPGIPLMGDKSNVFSHRLIKYYSMKIDIGDKNGKRCYIFSVKARNNLTSSQRDELVFDNMTTWFDTKTMQIIARSYDLSYNTGIYSFDVQMDVQLGNYKNLLVPTVLQYKGNWNIIFKKKEIGAFTATLFDFK